MILVADLVINLTVIVGKVSSLRGVQQVLRQS